MLKSCSSGHFKYLYIIKISWIVFVIMNKLKIHPKGIETFTKNEWIIR